MIDTSQSSLSIPSSTQTTTNPQIIPKLRRVLSPTPTAASTLLGLSSPRFHNLPTGTFIEVSPAAFKAARQVGQLVSGRDEPIPLAKRDFVAPSNDLESVGGCGLIIDYGGDKAYGDSFRVCRDSCLSSTRVAEAGFFIAGFQATQNCRCIQ
jgi:NADH dehydrogenase [ubiquinone] 1 alpha subcomplex assembly factor 7